jgi:hypothetical protein
MDPAEDGPEIRIIRREEIVQFIDWVELHIGEVYGAPNTTWFSTFGFRWLLGLRRPWWKSL